MSQVESKSTFTAGPWEYRKPRKGSFFREIVGNITPRSSDGPASVTVIGAAYGNHTSAETTLANASLIASAPDLLASLQAILACADADGRIRNLPADGAILTDARAAIAKATTGQ